MAAFESSVAHFPVTTTVRLARCYILWGVARPPVYHGLCLSHRVIPFPYP